MTFADVAPRRRCARCRMPSNRCPCRECGACSTDAGAPGADCACGRVDSTIDQHSELESPLFRPDALDAFEARGFERRNRHGGPA
jgi:hypothetical protein